LSREEKGDGGHSLPGLLLFFGQQHSPAAIGAALGADPMRQVLAVALGALDQSGLADGVMGAAAVAAALGNLTFWQRGHGFSPFVLEFDIV
jgi:hypothetical protein